VKKAVDSSFRLSGTIWALAALWTLIAAGSLAWNINNAEKHAFSEMRTHAQSIYKQDFIYRLWNAEQGGVYVPVTESTPPNPYLSHVPNRDVTTTTGKNLTLVNPAYMTRQVHELLDLRKHGNRGHITSLNPIRPENKADAWETRALNRFEKGESEVFSVEKMENGKEYFRYMHVMKVEKACLKCHAAQGYKLGDIRGGISVSVPSHPYMQTQRAANESIILGHSVLWALGIGALFFGGRKQAKATAELLRSEEDFRKIFEHAVDAMYLIEPQTRRIIDCNHKASEMTGYSAAELKNMTVMQLHPKQERAQIPEIFKGIIERGSAEGISGINHIRKDGSLIPIEVNASLIELGGRLVNLSSVRDITKRAQQMKENEEARRAMLYMLEDMNESGAAVEQALKTNQLQLEQMRENLKDTINAVARAEEARDPYTAGHQRRVAVLANLIARQMGLDEEQALGIYLGAAIHDIGKIRLPSEILSKPSRLRPVEYELIKTHPQVGYDILKDIDFPWPIADIALQHHERLDGGGYPQGLRGDQICIEAKIVAVADVVEAMASDRPYRAGLGIDKALEEIRKNSGVLFDPEVVEACEKVVTSKKFDLITLGDKEYDDA